MEEEQQRMSAIEQVSRITEIEKRRVKIESEMTRTEFGIAKLSEAFTNLNRLLDALDDTGIDDTVRNNRRTEIQGAIGKVVDEHLALGHRLADLETELRFLTEPYIDQLGIKEIAEA